MLEGFLLWFLRLFPRYREAEMELDDLSAKLREAADARVRAEDESIYWRQRADDLEEQLLESHKREIEVREMITDFISQQRWGIKVFSRAPQLPAEPATPAPIPTRRVQARHLVNRMNRERLQQLANK